MGCRERGTVRSVGFCGPSQLFDGLQNRGTARMPFRHGALLEFVDQVQGGLRWGQRVSLDQERPPSGIAHKSGCGFPGAPLTVHRSRDEYPHKTAPLDHRNRMVFSCHHTPISRVLCVSNYRSAAGGGAHISSNTLSSALFREGRVIAIIRNGNCSAAIRVLAASSRQYYLTSGFQSSAGQHHHEIGCSSNPLWRF